MHGGRMGYWSADNPLIWKNVDLDLFKAGAFRIVDGGAAGDLFEPFDAVAPFCTIYTFEPRGKDAIAHEDHVHVDAGLWSEPCRRPLHIAQDPTTSSIYPPDLDYLLRFPDRIGHEARTTARRVNVPLTSIDAEVAAGTIEPPHFIKLDIHSAEFEAIEGSTRSLQECLGFLVETWHAPIHSGQHLHGEIEVRLAELGYRLYHLRPASAWRHLNEGKPFPLDREQLVGSEGLFLREDIPHALKMRHVALLELFGYSQLGRRICGDAIHMSDGKDVEIWAAIERALKRNQRLRKSQVAEQA